MDSSSGLKPLPLVLKVDFELNTPDGFRRIVFGLEKDTDGTRVNWTITFALFERTSTATAFTDPLVRLNVIVAQTLHEHAAAAAEKGLTPGQTAHAIGPAADAAKAVQQGVLPTPAGDKIIQGTLA